MLIMFYTRKMKCKNKKQYLAAPRSTLLCTRSRKYQCCTCSALLVLGYKECFQEKKVAVPPLGKLLSMESEQGSQQTGGRKGEKHSLSKTGLQRGAGSSQPGWKGCAGPG